MEIQWIVVLAVLVVLLVWAIAVYNRLMELRNRTANALAQIDVQLKRRYDLIPNLVAVAKKYLEHESQTLEAVIRARSQAQAAATAMRSLSEELGSTENRIGYARQAYNDQVLEFNNATKAFPAIVVASVLGFHAMPMLQSTQNAQEREVVRVQF